MISEFEKWWKETFAGKLGQTPIFEKAIKEIAEKAWNASKITAEYHLSSNLLRNQ